MVKVYDGENYGEYAFSHIDENEIDTITEEVKNHVMPWAHKLPEGMNVKQYPAIPDMFTRYITNYFYLRTKI